MATNKGTVEVQATGPIKHGDVDGVTEYVEGDRFSLPMAQAAQLAAVGAVVKPGTKAADDTKEHKQALKTEAEIAAANEKAEAERKAGAEAETAKKS